MLIYGVNEEFDKVLNEGLVTVKNITPRKYGHVMDLSAPDNQILKLMFFDPVLSDAEYDFEKAKLMSLKVYTSQMKFGTVYFITHTAEFINANGDVCIVKGASEHAAKNDKPEDGSDGAKDEKKASAS